MSSSGRVLRVPHPLLQLNHASRLRLSSPRRNHFHSQGERGILIKASSPRPQFAGQPVGCAPARITKLHNPLQLHAFIQPYESTIVRSGRRCRWRAAAGPEIALVPSAVAQVLDDLGVAALLFLATTVVVVPTCKKIKISPILGFLGAGVVLNRLGLLQNVDEFSSVSQLGVTFLLFQMGLELSLDRLKDLAHFSFGLGLAQILACTLVFAFLGLPPDCALAPSRLLAGLSSLPALLSFPLPALPALPSLPPSLFAPLATLTLDEDVIIALALSLSSSAFVLNLLDERKELGTTFGAATLGVLLMQDIAVVPLLAILPVLEGGFQAAVSATASSAASTAFSSLPVAAPPALASSSPALLPSLPHMASANVAALVPLPALPHQISDPLAGLLGGPGSLAVAFQLLQGAGVALAGLAAILVGGQLLLKPTFSAVQKADAPEAFLAVCLLAVGGTALLTEKLGLSDSLGAFLAGAILSSTPIKADVLLYTTPYQKLFLGLFFLTTGSSIDFPLLLRDWPTILATLAGLLTLKTAIIALLGPRVGLSLPDSIRTAFLLSQGGEFAFVVLALANELGVLPLEVNRLLIAVVVLSMALTPLLNEGGRALAAAVERLGWEAGPESLTVVDAPCMSDFIREEAEGGADRLGGPQEQSSEGDADADKNGRAEESIMLSIAPEDLLNGGAKEAANSYQQRAVERAPG